MIARPSARPTDPAGYRARIEAHLEAIAQGRDHFGHLFAIERLARAARADAWAVQREHERRPR